MVGEPVGAVRVEEAQGILCYGFQDIPRCYVDIDSCYLSIEISDLVLHELGETQRRTYLHNNRVDPFSMLDHSFIFDRSSSVRITPGKDDTWRNSLSIPSLLSINDTPYEKFLYSLVYRRWHTGFAVASVADLLHYLQKLFLEANFHWRRCEQCEDSCQLLST